MPAFDTTPQAGIARAAGELDRLLEHDAGKHVGLAVGLLLDGESRTLGRGVIAADRPLAPVADAIYEIGSLTKLFTATLLADMARAGEVALEDPVQLYLPDGVSLPVHGRAITLADLACHTSGLPRLPRGLLRSGDLRNPYAAFTPEQLGRAVGGARLLRPPGARVGYSNFGFGLLGNALAARAGTSYEQLVRARICEPLALIDTSVAVPPDKLARFAQGHDVRGRPVAHWDLPTLAGAGALRSTVSDMLRFLALHLGDGEDDLIAAARRTQRPLARIGARGSVGLGWHLVPFRGHRQMLYHEGATGGFQSFCGFVGETRAAVVVLSNSGRSFGKLGLRLLRALTEWWPAHTPGGGAPRPPV